MSLMAGVEETQAKGDGDVGVRDRGGPLTQRGARARPPVRVDARRALGAARRRAGERAANAASEARARALALRAAPLLGARLRGSGASRPFGRARRGRPSQVASGVEGSPATIRSCSSECTTRRLRSCTRRSRPTVTFARAGYASTSCSSTSRRQATSPKAPGRCEACSPTTRPMIGSTGAAASSQSQRTRPLGTSAAVSKHLRASCSIRARAPSPRDSGKPPRTDRIFQSSNRPSRTTASRVPGGPHAALRQRLRGFSEDGREYVIRARPGRATPAPWCNVLANPEFGCLVSESSLGSTWSLNAGENRLTPWRNDPVQDTPSEALYLRDEETAAIWSPTPLPAGRHGEVLVRHGAGYTIYERQCHGLDQELTFLVPPDAPLKVVRLRLKNRLDRHRRLTATYYAEVGSRDVA